MKVRRRSLALLGFGAVGRAFIRQVVESRDALARHRGRVLDVVAICDSSGAVFGSAGGEVVASAGGAGGAVGPSAESRSARSHPAPLGESGSVRALDDDVLRALIAHKSGGAGLAEHGLGHTCDGAASIVGELPADAIVVDCTASDSVTPSLLAHIDRGGAVVLANKFPLVGSLDAFDGFQAAAAEGLAAWEATVGSGVPIIAALQRLIDAGDTVSRIEGTFSGTLNFVASELRLGRAFSDIVADARAQHFTEPDPRADLGGLDMARKALILARMIGRRIDLRDVAVEGLYPPGLDALDVSAFMSALSGLDAQIKERVETARSRGAVFRHVALVADGGCSVGPTEVPADSPLGRLVGTDNLVTFHSRWYAPTPLVIQGRGAGVDATAAGVLADVVAMGTTSGPAVR